MPTLGILLFDKSAGLTSNGCLSKLKPLFGCRKAGHTGSLDPLASGLLPVCFGESTKLAHFLLNAHKRYRFKFRLGLATDTGDADGKVLNRVERAVDPQALDKVMRGYRGEMLQTPPLYSALKKNGVPLYKLARAGHHPQRTPRSVRILDWHWHYLGHNEVEAEIECSKGFYIRSLVMEIGEKLNLGAYVTELRRLSLGKLSVTDALDYSTLKNMSPEQRHAQLKVPGDACLSHLQKMTLERSNFLRLCQGQSIHLNAPAPKKVPKVVQKDLKRLYCEDGTFGGIVHAEATRLVPVRMFSQHLKQISSSPLPSH